MIDLLNGAVASNVGIAGRGQLDPFTPMHNDIPMDTGRSPRILHGEA